MICNLKRESGGGGGGTKRRREASGRVEREWERRGARDIGAVATARACWGGNGGGGNEV